MNITRSNFSQSLPFIKECLKKSHFVAIDFEMTGVNAHSQLRNSNLDSVPKWLIFHSWLKDAIKILESQRKYKKVPSNTNGSLFFWNYQRKKVSSSHKKS